MVPATKRFNRQVGALIGLHVVLGTVCMAACLLHDGSVWHFAAEFSFFLLFGSQMLLLGILLGVSAMSWWQAALTAGTGLAYLVLIAVAGSWSRGYLPTGN